MIGVGFCPVQYFGKVENYVYISTCYPIRYYQDVRIPKEFEYIVQIVKNYSDNIISGIFYDELSFNLYNITRAERLHITGYLVLNNKVDIFDYYMNIGNEKLNTELKKLL